MLTAADQLLLRAHGYCGHHEVRVGSVVEGEPFMQDSLLYYFDGRRLMLCGYPLDRRHSGLVERVRGVACDCMQRLPVEVIWYCGPLRASLSSACPSRFRPLHTVKPLLTDAEMVVDCSTPPSSDRLRQWLRSARRFAFILRRHRPPGFKLQAAHYALIERFFSSVEMNPYLLDLAFKIPAVVLLECVEWYEAWLGERLVGIAAVIDAFRDMDLALFLTADRTAAGASDFLYGAMMDAARARGKRFLNLGPSSSEGHFRFKTKWGAQPQAPPYWWQAWGVGELARRDYDGWAPRLLQHAFFLQPQTQRPATARLRR